MSRRIVPVILGIDPGTACGFSYRYESGSHQSGVWDLKPRDTDSRGMRYVRLRRFLAEGTKPDYVAYEEVCRHLGTSAAHIYGGIVATIQQWCEDAGVEYLGIPVGTIKRRATGKGNASKHDMVEAAQKRWPEWKPTAHAGEEDNEADARWIAEAALQEVYDA